MNENKVKDPIFNFIFYRVAVIIIMIIVILTLKFINIDIYKDIKKYYKNYFSVDITASDMLNANEERK